MEYGSSRYLVVSLLIGLLFTTGKYPQINTYMYMYVIHSDLNLMVRKNFCSYMSRDVAGR